MADVRYALRDGVATVTLNRPKALNALTSAMLEQLECALRRAEKAARVIVLTGAGDRAFCAGADVKEYAERYVNDPPAYWDNLASLRRVIDVILDCGKPVVARLNGLAIGSGNELQLACDLTVAADHAELGQVGTSVGSVAAMGSTQWLPLVVGDKRAREMLFLNRRLKAREALEWGLVNWVVPRSKLDAEVARVCAELKQKFSECLRYTKAQTNALKRLVWSMTATHAQDWLTQHMGSAEARRGFTAFATKRKRRP